MVNKAMQTNKHKQSYMNEESQLLFLSDRKSLLPLIIQLKPSFVPLNNFATQVT